MHEDGDRSRDREWCAGDRIGKGVWSEQTRRGTVVIARAAGGLRAHLIGDDGVEAVYVLPADGLVAFVGAVTEEWLESGATGSFGIYDRARGSAPIPRPPAPPPGPVGDELIGFLGHQAHDQMDHLAELAARMRVNR